MLYEVQAGMLRRRSWSPFEQTRRVSHVVRHEEFEVTHLFHDLVLVKLQTPLQLNRHVTVLKLQRTVMISRTWEEF